MLGRLSATVDDVESASRTNAERVGTVPDVVATGATSPVGTDTCTTSTVVGSVSAPPHTNAEGL